MTKTIEELEADVKAARDASVAASAAVREAEAALQKAINEASGIIDHVLETSRSVGFGRTKKVQSIRILVNRVGSRYGRGVYAFGRRVLKDGSIGVRQDDFEVSGATDLGLYTDVYPGRSP